MLIACSRLALCLSTLQRSLSPTSPVKRRKERGVLERERERGEGGREGRGGEGRVHEIGVMCCAHKYSNFDLTAAALAGRWT